MDRIFFIRLYFFPKMMPNYNFQYCQKIVVYSADGKNVLLCKRKGESDFDEVFSFIGGKMEVEDGDFIS